MSLAQNSDIIVSAFTNKTIAIFSSEFCAQNLPLLSLVSLDEHMDRHSFIRNVCVADGEIYVCNVAGNFGLIILSIWE